MRNLPVVRLPCCKSPSRQILFRVATLWILLNFNTIYICNRASRNNLSPLLGCPTTENLLHPRHIPFGEMDIQPFAYPMPGQPCYYCTNCRSATWLRSLICMRPLRSMAARWHRPSYGHLPSGHLPRPLIRTCNKRAPLYRDYQLPDHL